MAARGRLAEAVLRRAGGNPLYAEEFVRLLPRARDERAATHAADAVFNRRACRR